MAFVSEGTNEVVVLFADAGVTQSFYITHDYYLDIYLYGTCPTGYDAYGLISDHGDLLFSNWSGNYNETLGVYPANLFYFGSRSA